MVKKTKNEKDLFEKEAELVLKKRRKKKIKKYMKKRVLIPFGIVIFFIVLGLYSFINSLSYQSTDDAFVEAQAYSNCSEASQDRL